MLPLTSLVYYKFSVKGWRAKGKPKLLFQRHVQLAKEMHHDLLEAFAEGDINTTERSLKNISAPGFFKHLSSRVSARPFTQRLKWTLLKYNATPRVVASRATPMPKPMEHSGVRQMVVRIESQQQMEQWDYEVHQSFAKKQKAKSEEQIYEEKKERGEVETTVKDVTEYLVLQQRIWRGETLPWKIWGLATEHASLEDWESTIQAHKVRQAATAEFQRSPEGKEIAALMEARA
jgi:hypothetical protein